MITFSKLGQYGRLGNQLWQIASTIGIAEKNGQSYKFPKWEYSKYFPNVPVYEPTTETQQKLRDFAKYEEIDSYYQDVVLSNLYNWNLFGYFQSWKYFEHCKDKILHYFSFPKLPLKGVAIHVRRGDYLSLQHTHPVLSMEYYQEAMKHFKGEQFTIFSDDIGWCMENFKGKNVFFFEPNGSDWLDFSYMAGFSKFIIANSSYSWWPSYLSGSTDVIAPSIWVNTEFHTEDRLLPEWTKI